MSIARHRPHGPGWLPPGSELRGRLRRRAALATGLALAVTPLAACGSDVFMGEPGGGGGGKTVLNWYILPDPPPPAQADAPDFVNVDQYGQDGIAQRCSTDEYTIKTQLLPSSATDQRVQLARRLAAEDSSIDLMTLDPPFVAEFADAGFLAPVPDDLKAGFTDGTLQGAVDGATWEDELVAVPFWANTQVLWFRKSLAEAAGFSYTSTAEKPGVLLNQEGQPVTWDDIIDAAVEQGGTVGVQANKYEGYVVWINALISGAGGDIVSDTEAGADASVDIGSQAGVDAAKIVEKLADSKAAEPDLSTSNEGTVLGPLAADPGGFMVNWTFAYTDATVATVLKDVGWARYPRTVPDEESKPPIGGGDVAVGAYSDHTDLAYEAAQCITSVDEQVQYALDVGDMPSNEAGYEDAKLQERFPSDLLTLYRESIDAAGPRPTTPYWAAIVNAILSTWHPADSVNADTPKDSASFIEQVLSGDALV
jgi:multiple sugar transport system substrate-binding protein